MKRIKHLLRPVVRRTLTPRAVQVLRFRSWYLSSYLPGLIISKLARRAPDVQTFGRSQASTDLAAQIQTVNMLVPTEACRVMTKYGSDKGWHSYTPVYSALVGKRRDSALRIFELGLGTNNLNVLSNMGTFGSPGASLRGWRELFPRAKVFGADIDRGILFEEDRIKTFYCDQLDRSSIRQLWSRPELQGGMDIIIEDGLHTFEANLSFLEESLEHLRPNGLYITEDISWDCLEGWRERLETVYSKRYPNYEFALTVLAEKGYNNLLVIRRNPDKA